MVTLARPPRRGRFSAWFQGLQLDIDKRHADIPILVCCAVSGLCDSVAFNASGVFVSMQTGNTIFLALGAAALPAGDGQLWLRALSSIAAFWVGCFVFSKTRHFKPTRRATLALSFSVQAVFILTVAALAQGRVVLPFAAANLHPDKHSGEGHSEAPIVMLPLALLAFQFGGQIVSSRQLGFNEVPTNVLTSVYCDLLSDPALFAPVGKNPKRNRRFLAVVLLIAGGIVGGWLQRSPAGMSAVLWIAGGVKCVIALTWLIWPVAVVEKTENGKGP